MVTRGALALPTAFAFMCVGFSFQVTEVTIIDDDAPPKIVLAVTDQGKASAEYVIMESKGTVNVRVLRSGDVSVQVSCKFHTKDGSVRAAGTAMLGASLCVSCLICILPAQAVAGRDYEETSGELVFLPGEVEKLIQVGLACFLRAVWLCCGSCHLAFPPLRTQVVIHDEESFEKQEHFQCVIDSPSGNCSIGGLYTAIITVENDDAMSELSEKIAKLVAINLDKFHVGTQTWSGQFKEATAAPEGGGGGQAVGFHRDAMENLVCNRATHIFSRRLVDIFYGVKPHWTGDCFYRRPGEYVWLLHRPQGHGYGGVSRCAWNVAA